jgi:hypothetical protein
MYVSPDLPLYRKFAVWQRHQIFSVDTPLLIMYIYPIFDIQSQASSVLAANMMGMGKTIPSLSGH